MQLTNTPGVLAASDVTRNFKQQLSTVVHQGGQPTSAANYHLYPPELRTV